MSESAALGLLSLLNNNVVELVFVRRHPKAGFPRTRRMFCTNSKALLLSISGKIALHHKAPTGAGLKYIPSMKNLVVTWDIMMQDYRQIPLEGVHVKQLHPVGNEQEIEKFWEFFRDVLSKMSAEEKISFMKE